MTSLINEVRAFLSESPEMVMGGRNPLWTMYTNRAKDNHIKNGEHIGQIGDDRITKIKDGGDYSTQYLVHHKEPNEHPKLRVEFKNHQFSSLPNKSGSYASLVHKNDGVHDSVRQHLKDIYDHELKNQDYVTSDMTQYEGGKILWKDLSKHFEDSGKHLYLHDGNSHQRVSHSNIINGEHMIWGDHPKFSNIRLVVSNDPL